VLRCLRDGCPWECGTRRTPACAERLLNYGLGLVLFLALIATLVWGSMSIVRTELGILPDVEPAASAGNAISR
jgi:hypothetical protein